MTDRKAPGLNIANELAAQRARIRRTLLGAISSAGAVLVIGLLYLTDMLAAKPAFWTALVVVLQVVVIFTLLATGLNRRFADPTMTDLMTLGATCVILVAAYYATAHGHSVALYFLPVSFAFAAFRYGSARLKSLLATVLICLAGETALRWFDSVSTEQFFRDIVPGSTAVAITILTLAAIGSQANDLRRRIHAERAVSHLAMTRMSDAVLRVNLAYQIEFANDAARMLFRIGAMQSPPLKVDEVCDFVDRSSLSEILAGMQAIFAAPGSDEANFERALAKSVTATLDTHNGEFRDLELSVSPLTSTRGVLTGFVLVARDTTESKRLIGELKHAASHDMLTGLLNRRGFIEALTDLVPRAVEGRIAPCVVAFDLNHFKMINDACGHHAGDDLLRSVADVMCTSTPPGAILARLGGDEFGIALPDQELDAARGVCERLSQQFSEMQFVRDQRSFKVDAGIGIAQYTLDCPNAEALLLRADAACHLAKQSKRHTIQVFTLGDEEVARHQLDIGWFGRISDSLDNDCFVLDAQRIVRADSTGPQGESYELLVRMVDPSGALIGPDAFLPSAERFQLIAALDRHVITMATRALCEYKARKFDPPSVAINLSPSSLRAPDLLAFISDCLESTGLPGDLFTFELTETAAILDLQQACHFFGGLRLMGCRVALDDVGSGFNSLHTLRQIPLDQIKIDGSYVRNVCDNALDRAFVESIQRIADVLQVETVAEFVEDDAVRNTLTEIGVDFLQGFGVHRPEPLAQVLDSLMARSRGQMLGGVAVA